MSFVVRLKALRLNREARASRFGNLILALERRCLFSNALLTEIEANPPGTSDNRYEYVELAGTPSLSLANDYFVAFDGAAGSTGVADLVVNLSTASLGSNGLLVIQSSATAGHAVPAGTSLVADAAFFNQSGGFLNGSLSFYLFNSPSPFTQGADYDTNDDGTLDHLPAGAVVLDDVSVLDTNNANDLVYGNVGVTENPAQNKGTADAVTRFAGNTAVASSAWYGGELVDTGNVASQLNYDATRQSTNEPVNAYLTPGGFNYPQSSATVTVTSGNSVYNGAAYVPASTVTGPYGTDSGATVAYTYYPGSNASGTALSSAPSAAGTYTVVANFAGDFRYAAAASSPVTFVIGRAVTTVAVQSSAATAAFGQIVQFAATVTSVGATSETGSAQFQLDGSNFASANLTGDTAAISTSTLAPGDHSLKVIYSGDANFNASTSQTITVDVLPAWLSISNPANATWDGQSLNLVGAATITSNPGGDEPNTTITGASSVLTISASLAANEIDLGGMNLSSGAQMTISADRKVLVVNSLTTSNTPIFSIDNQSLLSLRDNDLIVHNGSLAQVTSLILNRQITSAADTDTRHLTAIAVMQNNQSGQAIFSATNTFDGTTPAAADILVRYTYLGDANLDGKIDGSDYSLIDNGSLNHLSSWFNGDFNYDGVVNGSDYTLIDNAYNAQGAALAAQLAPSTPNPASVFLTALLTNMQNDWLAASTSLAEEIFSAASDPLDRMYNDFEE